MPSSASASRPRFPYGESVRVGRRSYAADDVMRLLVPFLSEERRQRLTEVVAERTYSVATVVEGVYDQGNVAAVMRTAEGLGFQSFHVVHEGSSFKTSTRTTQGAEKWLDVHRWSTAPACVRHLRDRGYRIVATHLDAAVPLSAIDFTTPTALVFGNEVDGVSDALLAEADERCIIPMVGFVQSFNISVAAAVALYHAYLERVRHFGRSGDLGPDEKRLLEVRFVLRSVKRHVDILSRLSND